MKIDVIKPGLLTTLQDAGRPGLARLGVGRSGAFDAPTLRLANALCGNPAGACALEITLLGPTLRFHAEAWIAVTGAPLSVAIDGNAVSTWAPLHVAAGASVRLGAMRFGCRSYLAIHGGFDAAAVLGSRSVDVNAGLGPFDGRPLRAGDQLTSGAGQQQLHATPKWQLDPQPWFDFAPDHSLRLMRGSHFEQMTDSSCNTLFSNAFVVQTDSNRTGVRLEGPRLEWEHPIEIVSEGCVPGLLQLPPSGQPIAFGPECPVSGGYPRIGQIAAVDLPRLAQLKPGDALRFTPCTLPDASHILQRRERALQKLEASITARLRDGFR